MPHRHAGTRAEPEYHWIFGECKVCAPAARISFSLLFNSVRQSPQSEKGLKIKQTCIHARLYMHDTDSCKCLSVKRGNNYPPQ